ncbi:Longitudinals lacking protein, isoforms A/B/D/L [Anthophora quadrimaculata]
MVRYYSTKLTDSSVFSFRPTGFVRSRFTCQQCGRGYTMLCNLRRHMKWECGGKRQFPCYYCSYSFTQKTSLQRHLTAIHKIDIVNGSDLM